MTAGLHNEFCEQMELKLSMDLHQEIPSLLSEKDWQQLEQKITQLKESVSQYEFVKNALEKMPPGEQAALRLGIIMTGNRQISEINQKYRGKSGPTDVITFPFNFPAQDLSGFPPGHEGELEAEVYISQEQAQVQARERKHSLLHEILVLLVHGIVHAFGLDHENSPEEATEMQSYESRLLKSIGLLNTKPLTR